MKKSFKFFVLALISIFILIPSVKAYTEDEIVNQIKGAETKSVEVINILTNWSNNYADSLEEILTKNFAKKLDTLDYAKQIDLIVAELRDNGKTAAANALSGKKSDIVSRLDYLKTTAKNVENFLNDNKGEGTINTKTDDVFIELKTFAKTIKSPTKTLLKIYYDKYYQQAVDKINNTNSVKQLRDAYDEALDTLESFSNIIDFLNTKSTSLQDIYNAYHLEDYEDYIREAVGDYYNRLKTDYDKLYKKLETKAQNILDEKIQKIVRDTDLSSDSSINNRNNKLWDIINYIEDIKSDVTTRFNNFNSKIKVAKVKTIATKYQNQIKDRLQEAIDYTKTYLIDNVVIKLKNSSDSSYITLNLKQEIVIYNSKNLSASTFLSKFTTNVGTLKNVKTYGSNIGTLSKLEDVYNGQTIKSIIVIVKGDIDPNGKFSITDVVNLCDQLFGKAKLSEYQKIAADMNSDSKYTITDVVKLCDLLFN